MCKFRKTKTPWAVALLISKVLAPVSDADEDWNVEKEELETLVICANSIKSVHSGRVAVCAVAERIVQRVDIKTGKTGFFTALAKYSFHSAMSL